MSSSEEDDQDSPGSAKWKRSHSPTPSGVSLKSNQSLELPPRVSETVSPAGQISAKWKRSHSPAPSCVSMKSDKSLELPPRVSETVGPADQRVQQRASDTELKKTDTTGRDSATEHRLTPEEAHEKLRSTLKGNSQYLVEGVRDRADTRFLNTIYTELYITEGGQGGVNDEHEIRQIERVWKQANQGRPIKCAGIFQSLSEQDKPIRTVLTKGVAGIGKTVSVKKFILDWAEGLANQDVHYIFPLRFRELNLMKEKKLSLVELVCHFYPQMKDQTIFSNSDHKIMFIFSCLDECRLPLDFHSNPESCDVTEPASVDVLLTNLIKGNLLPAALLWITSRPAAANRIPPECVDRVTEIRGFNNPQKKQYFKKRISDKKLADRTITHLKSFKSLYIMCHIPAFSWITASFVETTSGVEMPRTLTEMYTLLLILQISRTKQKYRERKETDADMIFKLGKLALHQLEKDNLIFYEQDLVECGMDVTEASVYSGICTQIFKVESVLSLGKVFCFVHLSIQEYFAALYVLLCFSRNVSDQQTTRLSALFRAATLYDLHKTAVDLALQSNNGHLDLFLRFLLGLSLESHWNLLKQLFPETIVQSQIQQTVQYINQKVTDQTSQNRNNLLCCLNELHESTRFSGGSGDL